MELRERWVHFRLRDVYLPDPHEMAFEIHADDLLQGRIVDLSDSGAQGGTFAVIEVDGIVQPVIVPLDRILGVV